MMSLFSPFDLYMSSTLFLFLVLLMSSLSFSLYQLNTKGVFVNFLKNFLVNFFSSLKPMMFNKSSMSIFICFFMFLLSLNFLSVFSFNFPATSQVSMVLCYSLGMWGSLIMFSVIFNPKGVLSHLIPEGSPLILTIFLFLIEMVSNLIRPLTLMVRLVANILAGHLLMILLSSLVMIYPYSVLGYFLLNLIEMVVALIQSYIFCTMIVLYYSEV